MIVMGRTPFYRTSNELKHHFSNIELERVHLLVIELEHPIFGFERSNIEPNRAFTRFTNLLFELTRTSLFRTSNELERVHLLVIELEHPIFGFERSYIQIRTLFNPSLVQSWVLDQRFYT